MNTTANNEPPAAGDDRWIDAALREHARLGRSADEAFLRRLDRALDAGEREKWPRRRVFVGALAGTLAAAACLALVATGVFRNRGSDAVASREVQPTAASLPGAEPLVTALPAELIEGTPQPIRVPHLVAAPTTAPALMVPEGTVLLSKGKPVTASDDYPIIGDLSLVTDGDKDAGEGYYVELMDGLQWVQIDLGKTATIQAVWIWHFHSQRRAYHDVIVQVSDDPTFKTGVTTVYNNDYDGSAGMGKGPDHPYVESRFGLLVNAKGAPGRYVRLYSNGNTSNAMNHYIEVEVFGVAR